MQIVHIVVSFIRTVVDFLCRLYALVFWPDRKGELPPVTDGILLKSAVDLAERIRNGQLKSEDVIKAYVARIRAVNPLVNAVVDERYEEAIAEARQVDIKIAKELKGEAPDDGKPIRHLPLVGIPFTCKDSSPIKGLRITAGLVERKDIIAEADAQANINLREAGAIPVALTNVPCMLMWWTADNMAFGRTCNPYDLSRIAGGSSGGEGALLASAASLLGVGSDVGGSIRIPAHCCGIFGHKTTSGIISDKGKHPPTAEGKKRYFAMGPMTRYAVDLIPMLKAMAGEDIAKLPKIDDKVDFGKTTIYYMLDDMDPLKTRVNQQTQDGILKIAEHFRSTYGTEIKPVTFTEFRKTVIMMFCSFKEAGGMSMATALSDGKYEVSTVSELAKSFFGQSDYTKHALIYAIVEKLFPGKDSQFVKNGLALRDELTEEVTTLLGTNGVFLLPSHPEGAPKHGTTILKSTNTGYATILNLLGLPATNIPIGLDHNGMPLSVQIATNQFYDHISLAYAVELEKVFGGWVPPFQNLVQN